ncbi:XDD3 family exosortase-dependent surface protein [Accumulibacter sp.]|uniref:XDD3 family exosortase-dependent surface protein n=1 Tax=Accumulibacter sp. TaxID=2053492 RepID=UPI0025FC9D0C|nr:XDD3 family exosortase-dependent surface protein [Accumulibacter sp.]MCM8595879.1 PEP-CTERM sorting domain-containing protein [Accumulibacter sp.]MCM8625668.1 PEP-CTERM sorting domain-containing protein [Accumulibacter sp.]MDS4050027.1 XDD3 domain-containing surface protein [Accumulibacter sp.]
MKRFLDKPRGLPASALLSALLATLVSTAAPSASAGTLYNGWNYAIDSFRDGSGGPAYEELGLAYRQVGNTGYFAISGGMPLAGVANSGARNGSIAPGDLFLNFSNHALNTQASFQNDPGVFAIRFASANDSLGNTGTNPNPTLGVFGSLNVVSLSTQNVGYATLQDYWNAGFNVQPQMGDLGTQAAVQGYLGNGTMYANISTGTQLAGITSLDATALAALGLDFPHFGAAGSQIFGFSFNRSLLPSGDFTAHFLEECINDGIALTVGHEAPEPGTLALLGLALAGVPLRRRR